VTQKVRTRKTPDARFHKPFTILQCTCTIEHKLGENLPCVRKGNINQPKYIPQSSGCHRYHQLAYCGHGVRCASASGTMACQPQATATTIQFSQFSLSHVCLSSFSRKTTRNKSKTVPPSHGLTSHPFNAPHSDFALSFRSWPRQPDTSTIVYSSHSNLW
jgi:hypothetical protein